MNNKEWAADILAESNGMPAGAVYDRLAAVAWGIGLTVRKADLRVYGGMIKGNTVLISQNIDPAEQAAVLAHEVGHYCIHDGDILHDPDPEKETEADQLARKIVSLVSTDDTAVWYVRAVDFCMDKYIQKLTAHKPHTAILTTWADKIIQ